MDEEGFLYIMSRSDDVINVAGHRLSSGALEEVREFLLVTTALFCVFYSWLMLQYLKVHDLDGQFVDVRVVHGVFCSPCCSTPLWATAPWWGWRTS